MDKENKDINEFEGYTFTQPFSRPAWGFVNYNVGYMTAHLAKGKFNTGIGYVGNSKNNISVWSIVYKDDKPIHDFLQKTITSPELFKEIQEYSKASKDKLIEKLPILSNPENLSNEELKELFTFIFEQLDHIDYTAIILRAVDYAIVPYLTNMLTQKGIKEIDETIAILSTPTKKIFIAEEEEEILKIAQKLENSEFSENSEEFNKAINELWEKYRISTLGIYKEEPRTKEDYKQVINNFKGKATSTLQENERKNQENIEKRENLIKELNLNEEEKSAAHIASEIPYLKDVFKENWNTAMYHVRPAYSELSKRLNASEEQVKNYWPEDIQKALSENKPTDKEKIEKRIRHNIVLGMPGIFRTYEGKDAEAFEQKYLLPDKEEKDEFKGRIACKGIAKGRVKVIHGSEDFHKVEPGDILVVGNTTPDYIVILKKVAGIVAEEGGITAHVSVISREFNIPAIVGVANATTHFKDNEEVEINADEGIVRKLK